MNRRCFLFLVWMVMLMSSITAQEVQDRQVELTPEEIEMIKHLDMFEAMDILVEEDDWQMIQDYDLVNQEETGESS